MASARAKRIQADGARQRARDPREGDEDGARGLECPSLPYSLLGLTTRVAQSRTFVGCGASMMTAHFFQAFRLLPPNQQETWLK